MREIKCLACGEIGFQTGPQLHLGCVRKQHTDNGATLGCLFEREKCFAGHPTVGHCFVVSFPFTLSDDHIEAIVAEVASLAGTLDTIAQDGYGFILQHFTGLFKGKLFAGHHFFNDSAKI